MGVKEATFFLNFGWGCHLLRFSHSMAWSHTMTCLEFSYDV